MAHKAEHADLGEAGHGAILAVSVCNAAAGDTAPLIDTFVAATENDDWVGEAVLENAYHSQQALLDLQAMNEGLPID